MNRKLIVFAVIAIIFACLFVRYLGRAPKRHYCDFRVYYRTGERFIAKEDIYARPEESITPYKYSPMFAMLISPLSFFTKKTASLIFFTINFILLISAFILSKRLIVREKLPFRESLFLYVFVLIPSCRFILYVLDSGQVTLLMFTLVLSGLYFLRKQKDIIAASFIALSIMIKYTPVLFLPYFLFRKKIKLVVFILIFVLIYSLMPAVYVGMEKEVDYVKSWLPFIARTSFDKASLYDYKNQSLFALSLRYFTRHSPYRASMMGLTFNQGIFIAFIAGLIVYLFILFPKSGRDSAHPANYSLLFILMVLLNPNAWMHNFVIFIFIYMLLFYYLIKANFKDTLTLTLIILSFALTTLTSESFVGDGVEKLFEEFSCITLGTLILIFLLFRVKYKEKKWIRNAYQS